MAILDVTIDERGDIRLIEANGSNGNMTSIAFGNDFRRAMHMHLSAASKVKDAGPAVVVCGLSGSQMHIAEYYSRVLHFIDLMGLERRIVLRQASETLGDEEITIVVDRVPAICNHITKRGSSLTYHGRPIYFGCNPNLLPELVRRNAIARNGHCYDVDISFLHDGPLAPFALDKGLQQDAAQGTQIAPLLHLPAWNLDDALAILRQFGERNSVAVCKIHGGSATAGIRFIPPSLNIATLRSELQELMAGAIRIYGENAEQSVYPIGFFEFARARPFHLEDGPHLWDMRFECLVFPDHVEVSPCAIRLCPAPFDGHTYTWDSVVSNLSGRKPSLTFVKSAMDPEVLRHLGIDESALHTISEACSQWCVSAVTMQLQSADGGSL